MMLDPFYLIVDSADWVEKLVPLGLKLVQLRIKDMTTVELRRHIRQAKRLCRQYNCQLIVNDYWEIALEEGCDFVHLGQEDLSKADTSLLRQHNIKLGLSTHSSEELSRALSYKPDYIALGPIFFTKLKIMRWAPQGLEKIPLWKEKIGPTPLVAIGGLTPERGYQALQHGADSVAVVTDVLLHASPIERVKEWLQITAPWRKTL